MTLIWLVVWLLSGTPALETWNSWLVALAICLFLDLVGGSSKS